MTNLEKAKELLAKMTVTEKVGQMVLQAGCQLDAQGVPDSHNLVEMLEQGRCGTVIQHANDMCEATDFMQKIAVEKSRLKIPLFINSDMIHGLETIYPIPLACACSFDTELVETCAKAMAEESTICGIKYTNAPMIDIARDPRWGRIPESQGEDPYLAGEMAKAYVKGFQNDKTPIIATLKHFAGYGACEGGRDYNVCEMSENTMLNTYLIPFREGIKAGAGSIMTSFNTIENIPTTANKKYLRDILRDKFGFTGIALSDAGSSFELISYGVCKDLKECAKKSITAGLDIDLGSQVYIEELENLVNSGEVPMELLDEAVLRVLVKKFEMGLFENPYTKPELKNKIMCEEYLNLSYKMALECPVLLKNDGTLPIKKDKKVALIGKFSTSKDLLGCWQESKKKEEVVTIYDGLCNAGFEVCAVVDDYDIKKTKKAIKNADVVLFNFGETSEENGEARSHHNLHVASEIVDCFNFIKSKNKKVVTLIVSGRPLIINEFDSSNATVMCWDLGHRMGDAMASLLSGKENFSGKLSVTIPCDEGQLPQYYAKKKLGRPYVPGNDTWRFQARYDDGENDPKYVFGYGLSYSKFKYSDLKVDKQSMNMDGSVKVSVTVENESDVDGVETVELYINDKFSEVVRPERELKDFKRVFIKAREKKTVDFTITKEKLEYYHFDGSLFADSGEFEVFVGADSSCKEKITFVLE